MANELSIIINFDFEKGGAKITRQYTKKVTVTGDSYTSGIQEIGLVEEELAQGIGLGTPGFLLIQNLDPTNVVKIGATAGVYTVTMKAGEPALYRHDSATVYIIAIGGACNVEYCLIED